MKVLIAIHTCERDDVRGINDAVRKTWVQDIAGRAGYRFFYGNGTKKLLPDEVRVASPDDYLGLPYKTKETLRWALDGGYDFIYKCDTDTYVVPARLLASDFFEYDYVGRFNGPLGNPHGAENEFYAWAMGGSGYWLSERAARIILTQSPNHSAEDLWVGQVIGREVESGRLTAKHDKRYRSRFDAATFKVKISAHFCTTGMEREFNPQWLYDHHRVNGGAQ